MDSQSEPISPMESPTQPTIPLLVAPDARLPKTKNTRISATEVSHHRPSDASEDAVVAAKDGVQWMTGMKLTILSSLIAVAMFLMMLDTSIIATAIPRITDEFHSLTDVGWYVSIYQLASAALQPLSGKIYQKFSNKLSFFIFLAIFEVGSAVCGAATSSSMLIVGRAIAGARSAGIVNGGLTITASAVPLEKRAALMGAIMGFSQLGVALGPLLGGVFSSYATWRWCFYVNLPIGGLLALGLFSNQVPDQSKKPDPRSVLRRLHVELDLVGFTLVAAAAVQLLFALSLGGNKYAWNSATVIGLFCGAGGTTLVWLVWGWYRADEALIPFSIMKIRAVWAGALTHWFFMTNVFCASVFLPMYFQAVRGASPMMSGVYVLASVLSQLIVLPATGKLTELTGYVIPYALLAAIIGTISNSLYSTFTPTTSTAKWVGYQILNGFGRGVGMPMALVAVQAALNPADLAMGNSIVVFVQTLGTAIMLAISDAIFQGSLQSEIPKQAPLADATAIIAAGATHFRNIVSEADLPEVLMAYSTAIDRVFILATGVSALGVYTSLGLGWVDVRKKQAPGDSRNNNSIELVNVTV